MARQLRIEYDGAYYHVFSRGNKQEAIFLSDRDRTGFLKTLGRMSERFDVDIFAFVLMSNHYHLLLRTNRANLSKTMQWLGTTYTTVFNLNHSQKGHLFQGRFRSIVVEDETYLTQLSCYIHRNPLRAGLVNRLVDYPWSSYAAYAYNQCCPHWLKTDLILSRFGPASDGKNRRAYREKVQRYAEEEKCIWEDIRHGVIYGSKAFVDRVRKDYLRGGEPCDVPDFRKIVGDLDLGKTIETASSVLKIDVERWKRSRRISKLDMMKRDMLVYYLWQSGRFSNGEIGSQVGLTISSVSRRVGIFEALLNHDDRLRAEHQKFMSKIKV